MVAANRLCLTCGIEYSGFISVCPEDQTRLTVLTQDERVGTVLADRYDILEIIGTGGMGTVYKARQRLINRIVAVKMLHKTMMTSADVLRRFQLEAQAASRLSLPNILTIYDFGLTEEGQPYMVMDYLNGTSLDKIILNQHHLEPVRALNIFIQACAALAHAHQHEVLHRDIKPSNIMLVNFDDQSDFVKIVDFGIAKMMNKIEGQAAELTKTGEVYGSPPYMSPEQCRGLELDNRADIYSLACVLYKSLVGKNPMQSNGDSMPLQIMLKHINEKAPSFAEAAPDLFLSNKLEAVVFKALEKNPDDRYQTMLEFKEALEKVRDTLVAESRAAQTKAEDVAAQVVENRAAASADTPSTTADAPAAQKARPRKQIIDDPTPHLPTAVVPLDQQLLQTQTTTGSTPSASLPAVSAQSAQPDPVQWPEVTQGTLTSAKPQPATPHNLSPSEFLSTLNSQLTQSALTSSVKPAPQPVASSIASNSESAQPFFQNGPTASAQSTSDSASAPASAAQAQEPKPELASQPIPPSAAGSMMQPLVTQPQLQSVAPQPIPQQTSTPVAPNQQPAQNTSAVQQPTISAVGPPASPLLNIANKSPIPQNPSGPAAEVSAAKPVPPVARATFAEALQAAMPSPDTQMLSIVQAPHAAATAAKPGQANLAPAPENGAPVQERRAKVLSQQSLPSQPALQNVPPPSNPASNIPNVPTAPNVSSGQNVHASHTGIAANLQHPPRVSTAPTPLRAANVSQTLKEMPAVDANLPTLKEVPALAVNLPGTPVEARIPASVLDGIKTPNVRPAKISHDTPPNSAPPDRSHMRSIRGKLDESAEHVDRSQRLSENRRKFIKHETDSSKTMLVIAGLAFVVILSAFFSFSYFNSLPKQAQVAPDERAQNQTAAIDQKSLDSDRSVVSQTKEVKPAAATSVQSVKPTTGAGSAGSATSGVNITSEIASVAPISTKGHKAHKPRVVTPAPAPAGSGVRRHAYSSYGMSY
ncbi:MAG: protein kinase [Candidatus Obscuribacterales bacterium]|nr:protein kinase [Candidatus Obscuribacterales bacterium]